MRAEVARNMKSEGKQGEWLRAFRDLKVAVPVADTTDTRKDLVAVPPPSNATCLEKCRDCTLAFFCRPSVASIFIFFALFVFVLIGCWGVIILWSMVGLWSKFDNGWTQMSQECLELAVSYNQNLSQMDIPRPPGARWGWSRDSPVDYCNENQRMFNWSIKWLTGCFSYINFLPIPYRLAIFHHVWLSHRPREPGVDFYGRKTKTLWFQLPVRDRRVISVLLNLAYILHYASQTAHCIYSTYVEGQTWPGAFAQNAPFITSIVCAIAAGCVQEKAEDKVRAAHPKVYPPRRITFLKKAWGKWRGGLSQGGLIGAVRHELREYEKSCEAAWALGNATAKAGFATGLTGVTLGVIDGTSRVEPRDGTSRDRTSRDGTSRDGTSRECTSRDGTSRDGTSRVEPAAQLPSPLPRKVDRAQLPAVLERAAPARLADAPNGSTEGDRPSVLEATATTNGAARPAAPNPPRHPALAGLSLKLSIPPPTPPGPESDDLDPSLLDA